MEFLRNVFDLIQSLLSGKRPWWRNCTSLRKEHRWNWLNAKPDRLSEVLAQIRSKTDQSVPASILLLLADGIREVRISWFPSIL